MTEITSIVIGEKTLAVTDLSKEAQQIIALFNAALRKEVDLQNEITFTNLAKEQLQGLLVKQLTADDKKAAEAAAAEQAPEEGVENASE